MGKSVKYSWWFPASLPKVSLLGWCVNYHCPECLKEWLQTAVDKQAQEVASETQGDYT